MFRTVSAIIITSAIALPAGAQDEATLRSFFEGRRVALKIDMPGTSDGVDVRVDSSRPLDYGRYGERLKDYGAAVRAGQSATVTLVKVKRDLIEFHLDGGGFGTFSDDSSTSVYIPHVEKSSRERKLEQAIKDEEDGRRRRALQRELDDLRDEREDENRRIDAARAFAEEAKKQRIAEARLRGGSRFNLRYDDGVPRGIRPAEVTAALAEYVDFAYSGLRLPRKGMTRADVERDFGAPVESSERREGTLTVTRLVFLQGSQPIAAEFVEDVLIRYSTLPR